MTRKPESPRLDAVSVAPFSTSTHAVLLPITLVMEYARSKMACASSSASGPRACVSVAAAAGPPPPASLSPLVAAVATNAALFMIPRAYAPASTPTSAHPPTPSATPIARRLSAMKYQSSPPLAIFSGCGSTNAPPESSRPRAAASLSCWASCQPICVSPRSPAGAAPSPCMSADVPLTAPRPLPGWSGAPFPPPACCSCTPGTADSAELAVGPGVADDDAQRTYSSGDGTAPGDPSAVLRAQDPGQAGRRPCNARAPPPWQTAAARALNPMALGPALARSLAARRARPPQPRSCAGLSSACNRSADTAAALAAAPPLRLPPSQVA
eukprot:356379-Chlamydomonas_euryale.AAC.8